LFPNRFKKIYKKRRRLRNQPATQRIYQSGRDNLLNVRFKNDGPPRGRRARQSLSGRSMALIALVAVGLVGDGFMLYALLQWMRDDARNRG
jgi:hypothetical protein